MTSIWHDLQRRYINIPGQEGIEDRRLAYAPYFMRFGRGVKIEKGCYFDRPDRVILEDYVSLGENTVVNGRTGVYVGCHTSIGPDCVIGSPSDKGVDEETGTSSGMAGGVWIGHNCRITAAVLVAQGARIYEEVIVGAGTAIPAGNYPANSRFVGSPARLLPDYLDEKPRFENVPEIALVVPTEGYYEEAAKLLVTALGLPQVVVLQDKNSVPPSVHTCVAFGIQGKQLDHSKFSVWELAEGTREVNGHVQLKLPGGKKVSALGNRDDVFVRSFPENKQKLKTTARTLLFYASERLRKGDGPISEEDFGEWLLFLFVMRRLGFSHRTRFMDTISKALQERPVNSGITLDVSVPHLLKNLDKKEVFRAIEQVAVKSILKKIVSYLPKSAAKVRNHLLRAIQAIALQVAGKPIWEKIVSYSPKLTAKVRNHLLQFPILIFVMVESAGVYSDKTFKKIHREIFPYCNNARRLASFGLAAASVGQTSVVEEIASRLLSEEWYCENGSSIRNMPGLSSLCFSPLLAAFLIERSYYADASFTPEVEYGVVRRFSWSAFEANQASWRLCQEEKDFGVYVFLKEQRITVSLLENWCACIRVPGEDHGQFKLMNQSYVPIAGPIEQVWLAIFRHIQNVAGCSLICIKPWPFPYRAALSLRYDVDRNTTREQFLDIVALQREKLNGPCGSWYFFTDERHAQDWEELLAIYQQEGGVHAVTADDAISGEGVTFHSGPTSEYWRGEKTVLELERNEVAYGEMLATQLSFPRPAWIQKMGADQGRRTRIWLLPLHFPIEGSTGDTSLRYFDQIVEHFRYLVSRGGHVILGSHPDLTQDLLRQLIKRESLNDVWPSTVSKAVKRCKDLLQYGTVRLVQDETDRSICLVSSKNVYDVCIEIFNADEPEPISTCLQFKAGVPTSLEGLLWGTGTLEALPSLGNESDEKFVDYYEDIYATQGEYRKHYTESIYYPVWTLLLDKIREDKPMSILELGCGSGQLAHAISECLDEIQYHGFDISNKAVKLARWNCPDLHFTVDDALATELFETQDYDLVIATEVLEHILYDKLIIQRIRTGSRVLATVPNFHTTGHVRHFNDKQAVIARYGKDFKELEVTPFKVNKKGAVIYVIDGVKA